MTFPNLNLITVRPEREDDQTFLREVYFSTRQEEMATAGFPPEMQTIFLDMQFKAQQQGYRGMFPGASFGIIQKMTEPIGRMVVNRTASEWQLVDIALLPAHCGGGIGTALIKKLATEAAAAGLPLRLSVLKGNRAARLYQRLGFVKTGESGLHELMELFENATPCHQ